MASRTDQQRYNQLPARPDKVIRPDGTVFDRGDYNRFGQEFDLRWETINGNASRLSIVQRGITASPYYFGINVPAGKKLYIEADTLKASEGDFDVAVLRAPDGFTGGTAGTKAALDNGNTPVTSSLSAGVTPVNAGNLTQISEDFLDAGSNPGEPRPVVAPFSERSLQSVTQPLLIRFSQVAGSTYNASVRLIVWEVDDT